MKHFRLLFCASLFAFLSATARAQTIPDQIDAILAGSAVTGNSWTILVENANGSVTYYQRNPTTGLAPASNTKIFTSSAAFGLLGTNYAFQTRIYGNGTFTGGLLTGDLNLVCEHDITWNTSVFKSARTPLDHIAVQLKALGLTNVTGNVQCYGLCAYNFGSDDDLSATSTQSINATAAAAFVAALQAQGITIAGSAVGQTGFSPPGTLLYTHKSSDLSSDLSFSSQPLRLDIACIPMLKASHNVMADGLCRHLGWKLGGADSYGAGATQVLRWINGFTGISTNGMIMNDGSGLSHGNRFSARQIVSLIRSQLANFPSWATCLSIGAVDGTLAGRFTGTDGAGQVHGKTGSLSISIALSGYIDNEYDNQRYLFSFVANKTSIDPADTRNAIDDSVVLYGARGVPISPELIQVSSPSNGTSLKLTWSDERFIRTGYRIYASTDNVTFGAPINVASNFQSYTDASLAPGAKKFYRVSVVGTGGESKTSRTYGAQAGGSPRVLLVDGNDRWQFQPADNPNCTNHSFAAITGRNISGAVFETVNHNTVINGTVALSNYPAVIWLLGEESTADETFSTAEQSLVTSYINGGGNLFVSGAEIAWDLDRTGTGPTTADRNFYHNQLRAVFFNDDANTYAFTPTAGGIFAGNAASGFDNGTHGTYNVAFPDVLTATNGSTSAISYVGGLGGTAAIQFNGGGGAGKLINFGFPFETITNSAVRDAYMSDVLRFFGVLDPPQLLSSQVDAGNSLTLNWRTSAGLVCRVQFKNSLTDAAWQTLSPDVTATNTTASKVDGSFGTVPQRFYRILLVN